MLFANEHAMVASADRPKILPVLERQALRIGQAARRPDVARSVGQPNRRDLTHPVADFPKMPRKRLGSADLLPIQACYTQSDLLVYELLRRKDIYSVLSHEPDGKPDLLLRRMQSAVATIPTRQSDH